MPVGGIIGNLIRGQQRLLQGLLDTQGGMIRKINVRPFQGESVDDVLSRFTDQLPGAFLSYPSGERTGEPRPAQNMRQISVNESWSFAIIRTDLKTPETRIRWGGEVVDAFYNAMEGVEFNALDIPTGWVFNPPVVQSHSIFEEDGDKWIAVVFSYSIKRRGPCESV